MAAGTFNDHTPTSTSSGTSTPPAALSASWHVPLPSTVSHAVTGLLRRFSTEPPTSNSSIHSPAYPNTKSSSGTMDGVYTPPYRTASPFQPPPLYPVSLKGYDPNTEPLLSRALAEEIRLLVPPRLQLCDEWNKVYSLEEDGVSLGTLYKKCDVLRGLRNGFVLVVKDGDGGVGIFLPSLNKLLTGCQLFGAYLTEAPHPSPHYFGTGECFLWRAHILSPANFAHLPPPPPADTTNPTRSTTIAAPRPTTPSLFSPTNNIHASTNSLAPPAPSKSLASGASTPERLRFKAFPYSGVNDYMMLCEAGFLSVGGGDGHYGLWLDDSLEKGVSSHCLTFGNEPLSDEGEKFEILGVEIWSIGNS
ncbi:Oxidation resistance 1 [Hyphodiscus hymeniophilus]|uniref:Oxidation resistance protein 1 n=1 Tax=Hyphodiscus hymeniophilus TaxID=353542 RepID=A0A9P6VG04_9HELO|nr:Oxidation resistance 1 [Hyphodiscus hymeniophilus]